MTAAATISWSSLCLVSRWPVVTAALHVTELRRDAAAICRHPPSSSSDRACSPTSIACRPPPTRAASAAAARQDAQEPARRALADRARRGRHLLRQARRGRGVRRRRHRRTSAALSAQSRQRGARPRACSTARASRSSSITSTSRAAGPRRWRAPGARVDVLVKVDVGFHRCGIDPRSATARSTFIRDVASLPGLRLRGLLAHAGHGYHAASEDDLRAIAVDGSAHAARRWPTRARARRRADRRAQRRRDADARAISLEQDGLTEYRAGQLRLLRSHAGRPRRGDARRLRADRAGDAS